MSVDAKVEHSNAHKVFDDMPQPFSKLLVMVKGCGMPHFDSRYRYDANLAYFKPVNLAQLRLEICFFE